MMVEGGCVGVVGACLARKGVCPPAAGSWPGVSSVPSGRGCTGDPPASESGCAWGGDHALRFRLIKIEMPKSITLLGTTKTDSHKNQMWVKKI